jgi:hypothetical protein
MNPPHTNEDTLAEMLVAALDAPEHETRFRQLCRKYPQPVIYRALRQARQTPAEKIRKSRVALFIFLVKFYGHRPSHLGP